MSLFQAVIDQAQDELWELYEKQVKCLPFVTGECDVPSRCMAFSAMFWQFEERIQYLKLEIHRINASRARMGTNEPDITFDEDCPF